MAQVLINDEYLHDIADSIRKMRGTTNLITTDSMAAEIESIEMGWSPNEKWERPLEFPDLSAIDISDFEGVYFVYDCTGQDPWVGLTATVTGGYKVDRGHIANGEFVIDETTNLVSTANFLQWIPDSMWDYVIYRITPQNSGSHITKIGQVSQVAATFNGRINTYQYQPLVERYGRLPYATTLSYWPNTTVLSDTLLDMGSLTTLAGIWNSSFKIQNIDLTGFSSHPTSLAQTFRQCYELKYVTTKNLVTSACTTMSEMFSSCVNLSAIDTSGWDTSKVTTFANAFNSCFNLVRLDVGNFDTSSTTTMANMFYQCYKLSTIDVSRFETSKVTTFASMFRNCYGVKTLDVTNFNTSAATTFSYMFYGMSNLRELDVSGFDTPLLTNTTYMFSYVRNLRSVDLSGWDASKITDMSYMFENCQGIESINLSGWNCAALTKAQSTFNGCFSLTNLILDNMVVTDLFKATNCMSGTFLNCYHLEKVDLSSWDLSKLPTDYASVFRYDYSLKEIIMPSTFSSIALTYFDNCRSLQKVVLPYNGVVTLANTNGFSNTPATKIIYVKDEYVDDYKNATNWKSVSCEFRGISELE